MALGWEVRQCVEILLYYMIYCIKALHLLTIIQYQQIDFRARNVSRIDTQDKLPSSISLPPVFLISLDARSLSTSSSPRDPCTTLRDRNCF